MSMSQTPGAILGYRRDGRPIRLMAGGAPDAEEQTRSRLDEIDDRLGQVRAELVEFADVGDLDEEQAARFDVLEQELRQLEEEREPLARRAATLERVRSAIVQGGRRAVETDRGPDVVVRTTSDPYAGVEQVRAGMVPVSDMRARALTAIELAPDYMGDDQREQATRLVEHGDRHGRIARHMLLTGSPAYERAFEAILSGRQPYMLEPDESEALRAAMSLTDANGGYLVPFHLDPTIILTNAGSMNPLRQMARVERITVDTWHGVTSAGVTAEWLAEAAQAADASPAFAQPTVPTHKAAAYLQGSFEVTQDSGIAAQVGMLLADARDNLEAVAFTAGTGSGQPQGVVTGVAAVATSVLETEEEVSYTVGDVYNLKGALPPRHRSSAAWLASEAIYLATRQFATGAGPQHAFWADLGMDTPPLLLGRPAYEASGMASTVEAGADILLVGNFSRYLVVDRIGMTVQYEPLVKGANQRPTGEVGWFAHWRVGGGVLDANAFRLLQVKAGGD